jgi:hypothetical protein
MEGRGYEDGMKTRRGIIIFTTNRTNHTNEKKKSSKDLTQRRRTSGSRGAEFLSEKFSLSKIYYLINKDYENKTIIFRTTTLRLRASA